METRYDRYTRHMVESVLSSPGDTTPELRRAVEAKVVEQAGGSRDRAGELPEELVEYVEKIAANASEITDRDVAALKEKGYSEDALFEITLSAALGAGLARLERGLAALEGSEE